MMKDKYEKVINSACKECDKDRISYDKNYHKFIRMKEQRGKPYLYELRVKLSIPGFINRMDIWGSVLFLELGYLISQGLIGFIISIVCLLPALLAWYSLKCKDRSRQELLMILDNVLNESY